MRNGRRYRTLEAILRTAIDRLIQSQTPESGLASHRVSVEDSDLCPIPG